MLASSITYPDGFRDSANVIMSQLTSPAACPNVFALGVAVEERPEQGKDCICRDPLEVGLPVGPVIQKAVDEGGHDCKGQQSVHL